ncbi:hypothetical protein [Nocardia donostiensis]|nr:hypothetical protein [Nocardia donostiensis]
MKALISERLNAANEAIRDIKDGFDRFLAGTRHFRGLVAITELDHVARHWAPGHWGVEHDEMLDILAESCAACSDATDPSIRLRSASMNRNTTVLPEPVSMDNRDGIGSTRRYDDRAKASQPRQAG